MGEGGREMSRLVAAGSRLRAEESTLGCVGCVGGVEVWGCVRGGVRGWIGPTNTHMGIVRMPASSIDSACHQSEMPSDTVDLQAPKPYLAGMPANWIDCHQSKGHTPHPGTEALLPRGEAGQLD